VRKGRKIATLLVLLLVMALLYPAPAYGSAYDEAAETAGTAEAFSDWFWCSTGYEDYC
jgi:hypothetical protein